MAREITFTEDKTFTENVDTFITKARISFNEATAFQPTMEAIVDSEIKYQRYLDKCRQVLASLREQYSSGMLSFAFIRLIHKEYGRGPAEGDVCQILGRAVHSCNTICPSAVVDEDRDIYADILLQIASKGLDKKQAKCWGTRFRELMNARDRFLVLDDDKRRMIIEACIVLGWSTEQLDYLLLRMGDDGLQANSAEDMIARFVLDVKEATLDHHTAMIARWEAGEPADPDEVKNREAGPTKISYDSLGRVIEDPAMNLDEKMESYMAVLESNRAVYQGCSVTARDTLEHILLLTAHPAGGNIPEVMDYLADLSDPEDGLIELDGELQMNSVKFADYSKVILNCDIEPLWEENKDKLEHMIRSTYSDSDEDAFAQEEPEFAPIVHDARLAYPSVYINARNADLGKVDFTARMNRLLRREEAVRKQDILFALFLLCAKTKKVKERTAYYLNFQKLADEVLAHCHLPGWYTPHVMEYTIAKSILGVRMEDVFGDIVEAYQLTMKRPKVSVKRETDQITDKTEFSQYRDLFTSAVDSVERQIKKIAPHTLLPLPELSDEQLRAEGELFEKIFRACRDIYTELFAIAKELCWIWENTGWVNMHIVFPGMSRSVVAYPRGKSSDDHPYVLKASLSDALYTLLHEPDENVTDQNGVTKNNAMLRAFFIPGPNGSAASLDDHAHVKDDETLSAVLAEHPAINRRFRRKVVLSILLKMLLNNDKVPTKYPSKKAEVEVRADPLLKLPHIDWIAERRHRAEEELDPQLQVDQAEEDPALEEGWEEESTPPAEEPVPLTEEERSFLAEFEREERPDEKFEKYCMDLIRMEKMDNGICNDTSSTIEDKKKKNENNRKLAQLVVKGDRKARDLMIVYNYRLIPFTWNDHHFAGSMTRDLFGCGLTALARAVDGFDPEKGLEFSTYAVPAILNEFRSEISKQRHAVHVPKKKDQEFRHMWKELSRSGGVSIDDASSKKLAQDSGYTVGQIQDFLKSRTYTYSINSTLSKDQDDNKTTLAELIADPKVNVVATVESKYSQIDYQPLMKELYALILELPVREYQFCVLRFGFIVGNGDIKFDPERCRSRLEIAEILHIPIEQVIRMEIAISRRLARSPKADIIKRRHM